MVKIYWSGDQAEVLCADNSRFKAQCILSTISIGVLKNVSNELFEPELPEYKLKAIKVSRQFLKKKMFIIFYHTHASCLFLEHRYWNCG